MKRLIFTILALFLVSGTGDSHAGYRQGKYTLFYSSLSTHGEWISLSYGRVWRPYHVGNSWRPYREGRWIWTDYGWYWHSYEPFGWATYHYGRWIYDAYYGWIWVPDDVWGPAWVEWRYDNDYIGWAPLPPQAHFSVSVGITFGTAWAAPVYYWNFVPCGNFSAVYVTNYIQSVDANRRIIGRTRNVGRIRAQNDRVVNEGIGRDYVERRTRRRVEHVDLVDQSAGGTERMTRGENRERLEIFRPRPDELRREAAVTAPERPARRDPAEVRRNRTSQRDPNVLRQERQQPRVRTERPEQENARPDGRSIIREKRESRPTIQRNSPQTGRERPSVNRGKAPGQSGKRKRDG